MSKITSAAPDEEPDREESAAGPHEPKSPFPQTTASIWQQIHDASAGDGEAVGRLCVIYREAILAFVRRWTRCKEDAEDLTQAFLMKMLKTNPFADYQRRDSKFRSFLLTVLNNFLRDDRRTTPPESEPFEEQIVANGSTVSSLDLALALAIHTQTLQSLREKFAARGTGDRFDALQLFILGIDERYASLAEPLGLTSGTLRKYMFGLREAYHDKIRELVSQLVTRGEIADEMRYLLGLLAQLPPEIRNKTSQRNDLAGGFNESK